MEIKAACGEIPFSSGGRGTAISDTDRVTPNAREQVAWPSQARLVYPRNHYYPIKQ
jgi:hypothetical protein